MPLAVVTCADFAVRALDVGPGIVRAGFMYVSIGNAYPRRCLFAKEVGVGTVGQWGHWKDGRRGI